MNRHEIRYLFEHRLLPQWFFEEQAQLIGGLLHDKEMLFRIINDIFQKEGVDNPYSEDDFDVEPARITEEVMMLKIIFPEPEEEPLCYCSYLFFDQEFSKTSYFCIEKGNALGQDAPYVCSWTKDGDHCNHGNCTMEGNADFIKCADIHMAREYGMSRSEED